MLPGRRTDTGELFVYTTSGPHTDAYIGGIAVTTNGAIHIDEFEVPSNFVNGFGVTALGALCVNLSNPAIAGYSQGLPFDSAGNLVCQLDQPASPGDAYVGGIRVGVLGGVCVTEVTPSPWTTVDLDHDGLLDHVDLQLGPITITDDADSYNIDLNGDGVADLVIPK